MTPEALAQKLKSMYDNPPEDGERTTMIHLFGILYANELKNYGLEQLRWIAQMASDKPSYGTELRKCVKLARYVEPKKEWEGHFRQ